MSCGCTLMSPQGPMESPDGGRRLLMARSLVVNWNVDRGDGLRKLLGLEPICRSRGHGSRSLAQRHPEGPTRFVSLRPLGNAK